MKHMDDKVMKIGEFDLNMGPEEREAGEAMRHRTLAAWAYIYSLPAFLALRQRSDFILGWEYAVNQGATVQSGASAGAVGAADVPPLGAWMMLPNRSNPRTATVLPAVDHLYGAAILQMDKLGPIVVSVPANPTDRYYSVVFVDAFWNNFAYIGPQWTGNLENHFLLTPPGWRGEVPEWVTHLWEAPSNLVIAFNRVMVSSDDSDLEEVRQWRKGFRFTQLDKWRDDDRSMPLVDLSAYRYPEIRALNDPFAYFRIAFDFIAENPSGPQDLGLVKLFRTVGIGAGIDPPSDPKLRSAIAAGVRDAQFMLNAGTSGGTFKDGWKIPSMNVGKAGPFIYERAVVQLNQIGSNIPQESVYYTAYTDQTGMNLDGAKGTYSIIFKGDKLPPVKRPGFWSLTMYKRSDSLLVDNPLNRYHVRTDTPGLKPDQDGTIAIFLSPEKPEMAPEGNWLPAPRQEFVVLMRLYYPTADVLEYRWTPPAIIKIGQSP